MKKGYCSVLKQFLYSIGMVIVMCGVAASVHAATITVGTVEGIAEQSATVPVTIAATGESVCAINMTITFDPAKLTFNSATLGAGGVAAEKIMATHSPASGTVNIIVYGLNQNIIADGTLFSMDMTVNAGVSDDEISISVGSIVAASNAALAVATSGVNGAITLDVTAPVITITAPANNANLGAETVTVTGTVDDATVSEVTIGSTVVTVTDGAFSAQVTVTEGNNTITVTAQDQQGNEGTATITVTYRLGDVNEDGIINSTDVTVVGDQVIGKQLETPHADINHDHIINVIDVQGVVNKL